MSNEDADFRRWLEIMKARAVNLNKSRPIYGKYHGRKVWFWRDGTTMVFQLDDDGCVVAEDRLRDLEVARLGRIEDKMTERKLPRIEVVKQQLRELQAELAHFARFPEDNFANGTVLQVVKTYKRPIPLTQVVPGMRVTWDPNTTESYVDQKYTYVLLKANDQWWCTGQNGHQINGASWDKVIEFVGDDELFDVRTGLSVMTDAGYDDAVTDPEPLQPHRDATEAPGDKVRGKFMNPRLKEQES